ncbi:acyl-CoA dehydrogenase family protein [Arthrobacter sp. M4]|uniref:acyl-CoA dehydrogenase family protein n=1 Tax=Arthrobacter sp. M4 TaxID=218160 RepID=UPI001CDB910D|nr:acyl-CoA dehydrogenase family protein [Arthrobacter sp. M4]MCA4134815.1 acyl-CoA/acyl-ACP dehydrogenase [Arthrobacter sp. M4]
MQQDLSEHDQQFLARITQFVDEEVIPQAPELDASGSYPATLVKRLRELGLFAASGRPLPVYCLALEEIARGWLSLIPVVNAHSSSVWTLKHYGTEEQKRDWLPALTSGDKAACLGLTEPGGGSDLQNISSTARPNGDGWLIDGHKTFITHADHSDAMMVLLRTDHRVPGQPGLSLFMLHRDEWEVVRKLPKLGTKGIETCELRINGLQVPKDRLIGTVPGHGFAQVMDALEVGRLAVAAAAVGVGRSALWNAVESVRAREAFGQTVSDMPAVQAQLAETANTLAAAKALTNAAANAKQAGGRHDLETSSAKVFAADAAVKASLTAMELAGGNGYLEDNRFAQLLRDAALFLAGEGSNGVLNALIGHKISHGTKDLAWL